MTRQFLAAASALAILSGAALAQDEAANPFEGNVTLDTRIGPLSFQSGYAVRSYEITETDGEPAVWRAVDWQPLELSAVPIGADAAAGFRAAGQSASAPEPATHPCHLLRRTPAPIPEEPTMTRAAETETTPPEAAAAAASAATAPAEPAPAAEARVAVEAAQTRAVAPVADAVAPAGPSQADVAAAAERARVEERQRIATIQEAARKLGVAGSVADDLVARGVAVDAARAALIDAAAARDVAQDKQEDFNPLRGFAGPGPGQNIDHVVARLTKRDLELLVGPAVLPLLPSAPNSDRKELEVAAARVMANRGRKVLASTELRRTILRNLDPGKLSELSHRLGADAGSVAIDDETWSTFAGFLGLDPPDAAGGYPPSIIPFRCCATLWQPGVSHWIR